MNNVLRPIPDERFAELPRRDLIVIARVEQRIRLQMQAEMERLEAYNKELQERTIEIEGKFVTIKNRLFGKSSEKQPKSDKKRKPGSGKPKKSDVTGRRPSERYPNIPIIEKKLTLQDLPSCGTCGGSMQDSGMDEVSEYLSVVPKKYHIVRQMRRKYRCSCCHGNIQTTPGIPRIKPGSSYSDDMIIDIALSKYCDLIPVERYAAMAARQGMPGLPPNSLIEMTHALADFLKPAVDRLLAEVQSLRVLQADETPHRMLEGDKKSNWFLWGFCGPHAAYFECHDTRSGTIAVAFLAQSQCEVLVSDVYSGYKKAVREANLARIEEGRPQIEKAYCNAHARRKFKEAEHAYPVESDFYLGKYGEIYEIEANAKKNPEEALQLRQTMAIHFQAMKEEGSKHLQEVSARSSLANAIKYFTDYYEDLTRFWTDLAIPIDNNRQERTLRSPVVGRKTWYGTHSRRGAETAAKLFSLVESCKLNSVNPRQYFNDLVQAIHNSDPPFTPKEYADRHQTVQ